MFHRSWLLLFLVVGCRQTTEELSGSCKPFTGRYQIEYVGGALGKGVLELALHPEREDALEGRLVLRDESGTDAVIELAGPGTCGQDLVHLMFGAGDHPSARIRVIGGEGTIVPARGRVSEMFGTWEVTVVVKADGRTERLSGFLRELRADGNES